MARSRFSETLMDHFQSPRNRRRMEDATGTGLSGTPGNGPYIVFQIRSVNDVIVEAAFQCHNCGVTVACGSALTELVVDKSVAACRGYTAEELIDALDGVPVDKRHVPDVMIQAMTSAIEDSEQ